SRSSGRACGKRMARMGRTYLDVCSLVNQLVEKAEITMAHRTAGSHLRTASARSRVTGRFPVVLFDDERVVIVGPIERPFDGAAVDEVGGSRGAAHARPRLHVRADAGPRGGLVEAGAEGRDVEVEVPRVAEEVLALQVLVVLEQEVVVLPEAILLRCALG